MLQGAAGDVLFNLNLFEHLLKSIFHLLMLPGQAEVVLTEMRLLHHGVISVRGVLLIEDS
jgi:hypothetical protein